MKKENERLLENFFPCLKTAPQGLLMLDYDGTLAPFRVERDQAFPYPGVREALKKIRHSGKTRLIIVTGRKIEDVLPLLGLTPPPEIWGSHGLERLLPDGSYRRKPISKEQRDLLTQMKHWAEKFGWTPRFERKPGGAAFHWRGLSDSEKERLAQAVLNRWKVLAEQVGFLLHYFDGGLEFRTKGISKGEAVRQLLKESEPETCAAYLGDDQTDEDAFRALGDRGLSVLVRGEPRPTAAAIRLVPPDELLNFLKKWCEAAGGSK